MASYQYVYFMQGVSKTYPGGKKCFEDIHLSFLPGVKIGVVGVNGAGKSTLMWIMAGQDKDFTGEAWAAEGARLGAGEILLVAVAEEQAEALFAWIYREGGIDRPHAGFMFMESLRFTPMAMPE